MRVTAMAGLRGEREVLRALLGKQIVPLGLVLTLAWMIAQKSSHLDLPIILHSLRAIAPAQWAIAAMATGLSFFAVGRMEAVIHRLLGTDTDAKTAQLTGVAAIATAQLTGFGLLTGTLARWRLLRGASIWQAARITAAVSASFMAALGFLASVMVLIQPPDLAYARPIAIIAISLFAGTVGISLWRPRPLMRWKLPPVRAQFSLVAMALLDTSAAALALYVLLPAADLPPPALFYTAYLLALGAGLLGATPGGIGPFELMFVTCLPTIPDANVLAAIMGYRLVYFAIPGVAAAALLIARPRRNHPAAGPRLQPAATTPTHPVAASALAFNAGRADTRLIRQGEFDLLIDAGGAPLALAAPVGQSLVMLSDPITRRGNPTDTLTALQQVARDRFLCPVLYKCGARTAATARRAGWVALRIADEARIDPQSFDPTARACRQLRRQLRKAQAEDVRISEAGARPPIAEMQALFNDWAAGRGGARGFSMGLFDHRYVRAQRIYLAYQDARLVAFLTLHESSTERALDLFCQAPLAPAGSMHLLLSHAIEATARDGCNSLSLAAVPNGVDQMPLPDWLADRIKKITGAKGLLRFKSGFAPSWQPLFIAAPNWSALAIAGFDLTDRITRPRTALRPAS